MNPEPEHIDYTVLPPSVRIQDTVAAVETRPVPDPEGGINPETAFLIRNAG